MSFLLKRISLDKEISISNPVKKPLCFYYWTNYYLITLLFYFLIYTLPSKKNQDVLTLCQLPFCWLLIGFLTFSLHVPCMQKLAPSSVFPHFNCCIDIGSIKGWDVILHHSWELTQMFNTSCWNVWFQQKLLEQFIGDPSLWTHWIHCGVI